MRNALRLIVRTTGELLITAGLLIGLFLAWQLWWTDVVANRQQAQEVQALSQVFEQREVQGEVPDDALAVPGALVESPPPSGDAFAIIHIPRLGEDYARPILEDTHLGILEQGVGHYVGTAMPGEVGNVALAGHRTTYGAPFNRIAELQPGDVIVIETSTAYHSYRVDHHRIVRPWQTEVIAPVPSEPGVEPTERWLTMTSCHPMWSARERYILHSTWIESVPRGETSLAEMLRSA